MPQIWINLFEIGKADFRRVCGFHSPLKSVLSSRNATVFYSSSIKIVYESTVHIHFAGRMNYMSLHVLQIFRVSDSLRITLGFKKRISLRRFEIAAMIRQVFVWSAEALSDDDNNIQITDKIHSFCVLFNITTMKMASIAAETCCDKIVIKIHHKQ